MYIWLQKLTHFEVLFNMIYKYIGVPHLTLTIGDVGDPTRIRVKATS